MTHMTQIEKLEHLKSIILSVPENQINLNIWRSKQGLRLDTKDDMLKAGAQACLMGWATADPTFNSMGFEFHGVKPLYTPNQSTGVQAVQDFFELTYEQASLLNNRFCYKSLKPTHNEITQNINKVINQIK